MLCVRDAQTRRELFFVFYFENHARDGIAGAAVVVVAVGCDVGCADDDVSGMERSGLKMLCTTAAPLSSDTMVIAYARRGSIEPRFLFGSPRGRRTSASASRVEFK